MLDLWPDDFGTSDKKPPIAILREQAEVIGMKTQKRVLGRVSTSQHDKGFSPLFQFVAPYLDNYSYLLFSVIHKLEFYPMTVRDVENDQNYPCTTESEFIERLKFIFHSDRVKKVIQSLLSQSEAMKH